MRRRPVPLALLELLFAAALVALFVRTFLFQAFSIPSGSMEQNLRIGDRILVNKFIYHQEQPVGGLGFVGALLPMRSVRRGDVMVFRYPLRPKRDFIKRCVALPGDTLEIERQQLRINDLPVNESGYAYFSDDRVYPRSVVLPNALRTRDNYGPYTVPEEQYFCLGDNRNHSHDSRSWGPVPEANLIGRAWLVYWSNADPSATPAPGTETETATETETDLAPTQAEDAPPESGPRVPWELRRPNWNRMFRWVR